jgi:type III secretion system FlhB-like substrate exporter
MSSKTLRYNLAVALNYGEGELAKGEAPHVALSNEGVFADEMVRLARRFGVPVVEEGQVARALRAVPVGGAIPLGLYEAVAVILDKLHRIDNPQNSRSRGGRTGR